MVREISAGGVVVRHTREGWIMAAIEPQRENSGASKPGGKKSANPVFALPKGLVDAGENTKQAAIREVLEETGVAATIVAKLADSKYVYVRSWGDGARVFKIVTFYLLQYQSGNIDEIAPAMRIEVKQASWIPLEGAERKLSYRGERDVVRRAQEYLESHGGTVKLAAE
jgi:8-oxo-dGTP diphosphatase